MIAKNFKSAKGYLKYIKKYALQESVLMVLMILGSVGTLVSPYMLKIIIDDVFPSGNLQYLLYVLVVYLAISILRIFITYGSTYMFEWVSNHIMKDIRLDVFAHLLRLPLSFFDKSKTGDIIHRLNSEVNSIQSILTGSVIRLISSGLTILGLSTMLCLLNWKLFLLALTVFPFIFINTRYFQPKIQRNIRSIRLKDSDILSFFMERFSNIRLVKSYMNYRSEEEKLSDHIDEQIDLNLKNVRLTSFTRNISLVLTIFVPILILWIGGRDVMIGAMTVGSLVAFIQYMNRLFDPFRDMMGLYFDLVRAAVSMDRINEILQISQETQASQLPPVDMSGIVGTDIDFRDVSFGYTETEPVLKNINLTFKSGKRYAIVGSSGCGKSTIVNLICRFYEPTSGDIRFGGKSIDDIGLHDLRSRLNLVTQDNHLFHDSIKNNILYGSETCSDEEIHNASKLSNIYDHIVDMPLRFDSMMGDKGVTLSGGQKQRIGIARALLRFSADVVLLDEATSAVDSETEAAILQNIYKANAGKTIIVVSHRLSAVKDVDEIICLNNGEIEEVGTHDQLICNRGFYWNLFKNQI